MTSSEHVESPVRRRSARRVRRAGAIKPTAERLHGVSSPTQQTQALARTQPVLPMMPGMPERRTHDYARHGVTSLFAAFNIADGTVISAIHRRHRAVEFKKFLAKIDAEVPDHLDVYVVADNYGTHKTPAITGWLARHPRFHMPFTPTSSSWINQVERVPARRTPRRRPNHQFVPTS